MVDSFFFVLSFFFCSRFLLIWVLGKVFRMTDTTCFDFLLHCSYAMWHTHCSKPCRMVSLIRFVFFLGCVMYPLFRCPCSFFCPPSAWVCTITDLSCCPGLAFSELVMVCIVEINNRSYSVSSSSLPSSASCFMLLRVGICNLANVQMTPPV